MSLHLEANSVPPSGWIPLQLRRVLRVKSGDMISADEECEDGIPIIGGNGVRGFTNKFNTVGPMIVVGRVGAKCGCVAIAHERFWASEHCLRIYLASGSDLRFYRYLTTPEREASPSERF
jgi:type I restriction enzyme S subunit